MPLKKLTLKPGVNQENTRYANENGWYVSDKVRFRQGTPEKIGGWQRISSNVFLGVCRSLWNWITLGGINLVGVGTNLKFYIEQGGAYNDITPLRSYAEAPVTLNNPFDTVSGSATINVNDTAHGLTTGDVATFSGAVAVGGIPADVLNTNHRVTVVGVDDYSITVFTTATSTVTGGGGAAVSATYTKYNVALTNPFTATLGSSVITVADVAHGGVNGDFVTFSGATGLGGNITATILNQEYQITYVSVDAYTITVGAVANATDVSGSPGGGAVSAAYQINVGSEYQVPLTGWGAGPWGFGTWGTGVSSLSTIRLWSQQNFGEDLVFGPKGGGIYYWDATTGIASRGVLVSSLYGASYVPVIQNFLLISATSRYVFAFGCNPIDSDIQDPMLIRWSAREDVAQWEPLQTNDSSFLRLSHGSEIVTAVQTRQEIVVFTDSSLYAMQFVGYPVVWESQLMGDNLSIIGPNAAIIASGIVFWMGVDKFYKYDGRVQTLRCDLRQYIYGDINLSQSAQVFAGTNEGFNEVWWFYCSAGSNVVDKYVTFNYVENNGEGVWAYGTLGRTAWLDSGLRNYPLAATYSYNLVDHEFGVDDNQTDTTLPINAIISSSEFDIDDGDHFGFVWRMLPDITFRGSNIESPQVTMTLIPMQNSGSGYNDPISLGGNANAVVTRTATAVIEQFTGQVYVRVRGRQMILQIESNQIGCTWQLGSPRIDIKQDGRRGNS